MAKGFDKAGEFGSSALGPRGYTGGFPRTPYYSHAQRKLHAKGFSTYGGRDGVSTYCGRDGFSTYSGSFKNKTATQTQAKAAIGNETPYSTDAY